MFAVGTPICLDPRPNPLTTRARASRPRRASRTTAEPRRSSTIRRSNPPYAPPTPTRRQRFQPSPSIALPSAAAVPAASRGRSAIIAATSMEGNAGVWTSPSSCESLGDHDGGSRSDEARRATERIRRVVFRRERIVEDDGVERTLVGFNVAHVCTEERERGVAQGARRVEEFRGSVEHRLRRRREVVAGLASGGS